MTWVLIVTILGGGTLALPYGINAVECQSMARELKADRENIADAVCQRQAIAIKAWK